MGILTQTHNGLNFLGTEAYIQADGSTKMTIKSNGKVGIGTTSPESTLHVYTASGQANIKVQSGGNDAVFFANASTNFGIWGFDNARLSLATNSTERVSITGDGNVGIGTTSPSYKLDVAGDFKAKDGSSAIAFNEYGGGAVIWMDGANGDFTGGDYFNIWTPNGTRTSIGFAGNEILSVTSGSNVGIGTTSPSQKLEVSGNIKIGDSDALYLGAGNDLQIWHDGTNSVLNNVTGNLQIYQQANDKDIQFICDNGSGGVATYFYLDGSLVNGTDVLGATRFPDKSKIYMGTDGDLEIYHDASDSYVNNFTGHLTFTNYADDKHITFKSDNGSGGTETYFYLNGVTGFTEFTNNAQFVDNAQARFGSGSDLRIYHNGTHSFISDQGSGNLTLLSSAFVVNNAADSENMIIATADGSVRLYHNGSEKFETTTYGVEVTGGISSDGNAKSYTWRAVDNTSNTSAGYHKIARIYSSLSTRFVIEIAGRSTSYGDGDLGAMGYIVGQLNNDDNYDIIYYNHSVGAIEVVQQVGQVDVDATQTDIYVKVGDFAEVTAHAHISDGSITVDSSLSGSEEPTNYVAATEVKVFNSGGDISLGDSKKIKLGNGDDLQIYHDGSNSYIEDTGTGDLIIKGGNDIIFRDSVGNLLANMNESNSVELYYGGSKKLETTSTGASVTGALSTTSGGAFGTDSQTASVYMSVQNQGLYGNFSGYARNLIKSNNSGVVEIGHVSSLVSGISLIAGSSAVDGTITFSTKASERMRVHHNGNVGIGTTSPGAKLDVAGTSRSDLHIFRSNQSAPTADAFIFRPADNTVALGTANAERMRIDSSGNVGIGTTSPNAKLEVRSDGSAAGGAEIRLQHANNNSTDVVSTLNFANNVGSVAMIQSGTTGANNTGYISFFTDNAGTSSEKMRILGNGNVGIGTDNPGEKLEISGTGELSAKINNTQYSRSFTITQGGGYSHLKTSHSSGVAINYGQGNAGIFSLFNNTTQAVKINANGDSYFNGGNVGIGTTNPTELLELDRDGKIGFGANGDYGIRTGYFDDTGGVHGFHIDTKHGGTWSTRRFVVRANSGNVGIGTDSPSQKLHVAGNVRINDGYTLGWGADTTKIAGNSSANTLSFKTASTDRLYINSSGNVGIGTTNPSTLLDIRGAGTTSNPATSGTTVSTGTRFRIASSTSATAVLDFGISTSGKSWLQSTDRTDLSTEYPLLLNPNGGKVGIGTDNPGEKLHVAGNIRATGWIGENSSNRIEFDESNNLNFYVNGVWVAQMQPDGDLHVKGDVIAFSDIFNP